ncbi:MAG TPA: cytochrome c3 family protein [Kofleriaceae bacterium]
MTRALVVIALCCMATPAFAGDFFASSPGQLAQSHASLDNQQQCNACHVNDSKDLSNDKCLDCHDHNDLRDRIKAGKGFHTSSQVKGKNCWTCHKDHKGRGFNIMGWGAVQGEEKGFDHDTTGWPLNGKHAKTDCAECHKTKNKQGLKIYMGTDKLCGSSGCHNDDQPHKFERREMLACERCHTESVWKPEKPPAQQRFNHDDRKDAAMPLFGSHKDVACGKCHPKAVFNLPSSDPDGCGNNGCHQSTHNGHLFGKRDCEWCHSPTFKTLKQQNFDHTEKTKFDLGPAHRAIACYNCHTKALGEGKPTGACEQCHSKDSHHGNRFSQFGDPPKCGICHPSGGPKFTPKAFNHGSRTNFNLTGRHADVPCRSCHRGKSPSDFERLTPLVAASGAVDCMGCHQHTNVHDKKFKNNDCTRGGCHSAAGKVEVDYKKLTELYHGSKSSFPLVKGHKGVPCGDCHTGRSGKKGLTTFDKIPADCNASGKCHEDSLHKGTLGEQCVLCHSSGTWDALKFDHDQPFPDDAQGDVKSFPLKGEHKKNDCEDCHPQRKFAETPATCSADGCHADDDAHKGRLGDKCERCHVETGDNTFNHNTMSVFPLDGKHLDVRCADCHPSITFKPRPQTCFGCHPEPRVHKGQYGTACEQCHTTRTFQDVKPLHDVGDFSLRGMHDSLACERCHKDKRPLAGSGNLCINCHRQDDIHANSLSPRCGECHTQWSFTPARFDHSKVGCNLTGVHRTYACQDCHRTGNYVGLSATCASCHRDDAIRIGNVGTNHAIETNCARCHNPNYWKPAVGTAPAGVVPAFGRDSVCR